MPVFVEDNNGVIFSQKRSEEHNGMVFKYPYLKISPWKEGEDRRYDNIDIKRRLSKTKAFEIVNQQFRLTPQKWIYLGQKFEAKKCFIDYDNPRDIINQMTIKIERPKAYLFMCKGKLVYGFLEPNYLPRVFIQRIDNNYCSWTNFRWLKPIYNLSENKWV